MRIPQVCADKVAARILSDYPQAVGVATWPLPIGCVFVIGHPLAGKGVKRYIVGLLSDDTKGCAVLKRTNDEEDATHTATTLSIALVPFMNASLDLMGVDHTHMEV